MASSPITIPVDHALLQRLAREGQISSMSFAPPANYSAGTHPTVTAGTFTTIATTTTPLGRIRFMLEAHIGADQGCAVAYTAGQSNFSGSINQSIAGFSMIGTAGGNARWKWDGNLLIPELCSFGLGYTNPTTSGANTAGGATWVDVTADLNFKAQSVILFIGDSITYAQAAGSNGVANMNGNNGFPMMIRNHLLSKKVDVRHVNKGVSGMTSPQALIRFNDNSFYHCIEEREKVRLIVEAMGMNDAATPIAFASQSAFNATYDTIYTGGGLLDYYPNAELIAMSHTGTDDSAGGRVTNSATIRGYKQTWVGTHASDAYAGRIHFADGTKAYGGSGGAGSTIAADGSISTTFLGDLTIHPNIAGHAAIVANVLGPAIAATNWGQAVLKGGSW